MNREIISSRQGIVLMMLFLFGSTFVVGAGGEAKKDMWLAILLAMIAVMPMGLIYASLISRFPGKDLYDILILTFGKAIGKIIILLYTCYALHLGGLVLYNFNEFISNVGLGGTPRIVPSGIIILLCAWIIKQGIEGLGRWGEIFLPILLFIIFMALILSIPNLKAGNILPVLEDGIMPVIKGTVATFSFPMAETVLFTLVLSSLKSAKDAYRTYILAIIFAGSVILLSAVRNTMVLGTYLLSLNYYPTFVAVARINIGNFLQRLESAVAINFLITGFVKISICLLAASKGISKIFNFEDYRFIVIPTALIILNFSFIVTEDPMGLRKWNQQVYPYYAGIFQVILPIIIFICSKLRYGKVYNKGIE